MKPLTRTFSQLAAGGGQQCNPLSIAAFSTLLAAPGPCEQQDAADNMIDLGKTLTNNSEVIRLTQIFAQQPRNTASFSISTLIGREHDLMYYGSPHRRVSHIVNKHQRTQNLMDYSNANLRELILLFSSAVLLLENKGRFLSD